MGQRFFEDSIGTLTHSTGVLSLSESRITLGGQQEHFTTLSYTISGLLTNTKYNLFLVKSGGVLSLVPSTNAISVGPTGYTLFKFIRSFMTSSTATFGSFTAAISDPNPVGTIIQSMLSLTQFQSLYGTTWVLANGASASGTMYNSITGNANLPDARGIFLRGAGTSGTLTDATGVAFAATLGNTQNDSFQGHTLGDSQVLATTTTNNSSFPTGADAGIVVSRLTTGYRQLVIKSDGANGAPRYGTENRPANLAVNTFIKINME